jgi:hypothetical protein
MCQYFPMHRHGRAHAGRLVSISLAIAGAAVLAACSGESAMPHAVLDSAAHVEHPAKTITTRVPGANGCPMFPANNIWNTDISHLPIDSHSAAWLRDLDSANLNLHPDFGPSGGYPYGIPYTIVTSKHRRVRVAFQFPDSDHGLYPFGPDTQIEGGKSAGGDRHALMVNRNNCFLYELWEARYSSHPHAGSGAIWNLRSNKLRPAGKTSSDAAGLPVLPGLLNYAQVAYAARTGKPITHAIRMTADQTSNHYIWPARHRAGSGPASAPPMGARFRLKSNFNVAGYCSDSTAYCKDAKAVLVEMQHYGLILADNGSNWYFGGSAFPQWPDALVEMLKNIPARAFVAVDDSCLMVSPNSGEVRGHAGCRIG